MILTIHETPRFKIVMTRFHVNIGHLLKNDVSLIFDPVKFLMDCKIYKIIDPYDYVLYTYLHNVKSTLIRI